MATGRAALGKKVASRREWLIATAVAGTCTVIAFMVGLSYQGAPTETVIENRLAVCIDEMLLAFKPDRLSNTLLRETIDSCYHRDYQALLLNDFQIRRAKFAQQVYDERVLLWMVVAITISGVGLAALQLVISYKLASRGKSLGDSGEHSALEIERNRISLKSSVTGLFILIISFAFFLVFVLEIFKLTELNIAGHKTHAIEATTLVPTLPGRLPESTNVGPAPIDAPTYPSK